MRLTFGLLLNGLLLCGGSSAFAQSPAPRNTCKPPIGRALWHDRLDREQRNAQRSFQGSQNEEVRYYVAQTLTVKIDNLQCKIETDTSIGDQKKKTYLGGLEKMVKNFATMYRKRQFQASHFPSAIESYDEAIQLDLKKESIEPLIDASAYEVGALLLSSDAFNENPGIRNARNVVFRKYCVLHPDQIFLKLKDNPDVPFRDSLIKIAGYKYPRKLYDFAAADNRLGVAIRNVDDPFIRTISRMAKSGGSGQLYFPFLDNLIAGRITYDDINAVKDNDGKYYQLLVKTRMDYIGRTLNGEKIVSLNELDAMLQRKGRDHFIKTINALHEEPDAKRFAILNQLNAQELYYLVIAGERDMYTSSYVNGIYPLMMQKIGNRGDSLMMSVSFDRFKKFIKIAAGYNTLSSFLSTFPDNDHAQALMTGFVNNLEKSSGLEDGVDVADSYASIAGTMKPVADEMLKNVKLNLDRNIRNNNKKGIVIYNLLYKLFLSSDSLNKIDLSKEFGIPPVYNVSYSSLSSDSSGRVVMQVFFYGDKDGKMNYASFLPQFSNGNWKKIEDNKYWVAFSSTKGKPIMVYANKPLDENTMEGELEKGQEALGEYLSKKNLDPSVVIHRGHSYYAPYTIEQIKPSARVVFLGSCGGYNLVHSVLRHSPDAHIIASKQIGKLNINKPFIELLNEKLRNGHNIDWIPFWNEFRSRAGGIDGFEDYIAPYKNLGVIFIKAYNIAMGEDSEL